MRQLAERLAEVALFVLPALVLTTDWNLSPFAGLLLLSSLCALPALRKGWLSSGALRWPLLFGSVGVVIALLVQSVIHQDPLRDIDSLGRLLAIPWLIAWICALKPDLRVLWLGAVAGVVGAACLAGYQYLQGVPRAGGWTNPIVFADGVVALLVVVLFVREPGRGRWGLWLAIAGCTAVLLLSGSRGAWPAFMLILLLAFMGSQWGTLRQRGWLVVFTLLAVLLASMTSTELRQQARLLELEQDLVRISQGDGDSSLGARLQLWQASSEAMQSAPLSGVGFGRFDRLVQQLPECRVPVQEQPGICYLKHAHNDLAEWGATAGVPGLVALLVTYGVPLAVFLMLWRRQRNVRGPEMAGVALVLVYVVCGLTQSMFAHQLSAGIYACLVGIFAGQALRVTEKG